jgi:hypothetical protein
VLVVRLDIYQALEKWDLMKTVACRLVRHDENDVRSTVLWATATRRTDCLAAAQVILLEAVERLPDAAAPAIQTGRLRSSTRRSGNRQSAAAARVQARTCFAAHRAR